MSSREALTLVQPLGYSSSTCGYCSEEKGKRSKYKSGKSYGFWAHQMSCDMYEELMDKGWRRSGKYLYKPDMRATSCPQYTISLDATAFKPSRSQRQLLRRFSTFVRDGGREGTVGWGSVDPKATTSTATSTKQEEPFATEEVAKKLESRGVPTVERSEKRQKTEHDSEQTVPHSKKGKGKASKEAVGLVELVIEPEWEDGKGFKHRFECTIELSSFSEEKFQLYSVYQQTVHNETASKVSRSGFKRFLVDTPLVMRSTGVKDYNYGSHHVLYRDPPYHLRIQTRPLTQNHTGLDGTLIALAVIDLLPTSLSSVYFIWSPLWSGMGLGKVGALREIGLVQQMREDGLDEMGRYMMGFYIHTTPKMRYKAEYQPSSLLDPDTNVYYPFEHCKSMLDADRHASFSNSRHASTVQTEPSESMTTTDDTTTTDSSSSEQDDSSSFPSPPPPGCLDPSSLSNEIISGALVLEEGGLTPFPLSSVFANGEEGEREVKECLAALNLGEEGRGRIAFVLE